MLLNVDWRNPVDHLDVNGSASITPLDALLVINDLNALGSRALPDVRDLGQPFIDTTGNQGVSALDALLVINYLNEDGDARRTLTERGTYGSQQEISITLGQGDGARNYRMQVDADFGEPSGSSLVPDLFSVYLVDPADSSQTLLDRGVNGTSLFSLSPRGVEMAGGLARWDGSVLELDLSSIADRDTGLLRLQLLNGDASSAASVSVLPLDNSLDPDRVAGQLLATRDSARAPGQALDLGALTASDTIQLGIENVRFDPAVGGFIADVGVSNPGSAIGRDVVLVLPGLPTGVTLANASGVTPTGAPYLNLREAIRPGGLGTNGRSDRVELRIDNPANQLFSLQPQILVGIPNRAPTLAPIPTQTVMPGGHRAIPLVVTDPDSDAVTYSVREATGTGHLPTGHLQSGTGSLVFMPASSDLGTYQIEVLVSDGALTTSREFTLNVVADPITTTRVSGRVLNVDETPIAGMIVEIGGVQTLTQSDGSFLLDLGTGPIASDTIKIRGETYSDPGRPGVRYPFIAEKLPFMFQREVYPGFNNDLVRPIYLPPLNAGTPVDPTADTTIEATLREGHAPVEVFVAAGSLFTQQGAPFSGNLSITEVPVHLTPAALPPDLRPDLLITIQPGEMVFSTPAPLTFPNTAGWAPGAPMDLWSINPVTGEFEIVGQMQVSGDGETIETISGGIRNSSWHFPAPPPPEPKPPEDGPRTPDEGCKDRGERCAPATSGVLLHSGALMESHSLVSYNSLGQTRELTLTYDSLRADPRPIVHFGYANLVGGSSDTRIFASMEIHRGSFRETVPGYLAPPDPNLHSYFLEGKHYWSTVVGDLDVALQADLRSQPSGRYEYSLRIGEGILQRVRSIVSGYGDAFEFWQISGTSTQNAGKLISVNSMKSPFGAGWGLNGLKQIVENSDRSLLLIDGGGSEELFELDEPGDSYRSPPGDFSRLEKLADGSFRQTFPDQTVLGFNALGMLASIADRNGNTTRYIYGPDDLLEQIVDPAGLKTRFAYVSGHLDTVTDPAGRITRMQYDADGNLTRMTDPDGSFRTFVYDAQHHMVGEVDQLGQSEHAEYGFHGRVTGVTRKDGSTAAFNAVQVQGLLPPRATSDPFRPAQGGSLGDPIARYTDARGNVIAATLDRAGQEVASSDSVGNLPAVQRNEDNLVISSTDARGFISEFSYDTRGNLLSISDDISRISGGSTSHLFPGERFATGRSPLATAAGDFNGDGFNDLATANRDSGDLSILLGNGDGTFAPERRISTGGSPQAVATGDVNGDGILDLATASYSPNGQAVVRVGFGGGAFSAPQIISTDGPFTSVAMGDFDKDGNLDIAAAGLYGSVYVMLGRGDGLFADAQDFAVGYGVRWMTAGDFNNDGALDLAMPNGGSAGYVGSTLSVLLGNGDGTFADVQHIETGIYPVSVTTGDFNGDGTLDLVAPNYGDGWTNGTSVSVLTGRGDGTFSAPESFPAGIAPHSLTTGDFNGDGLLDLATANAGSHNVSVLLSHGDGTFAAPLNFAAGSPFGGMTAADFNGDGTPDLAIPNSGIDVVTVLLGKGDGTMTTQYTVGAGETPRSLTTGDFNGDGVLDLAVGNFGDVSSVSVRLGMGDGTFGEATAYEVGSRAASVTAGDFNRDGFLDLVTANNYWSSDLSLLLGNGDGTFAEQIRTSDGGTASLTLGDFNADGLLDLASTWAVLLGNGDATFASPLAFPGGHRNGSVAAADFNGDQVLDLVVTNTLYHAVSVLLGKGDGTFFPEQGISTGIINPIGLATGDFNEDGVPDIAVGGNYGDSLAILLGEGDGTFEASLLPVAGNLHSVTSADFNGDGVLDLAVAQYDSHDVLVLLGRGDGTFTKPIRFAAGSKPYAVTTRDFNGDGLLDIAVANQDSADVSVLLANPRPRLVSPPTFTYDETFNQLMSAIDELGRQTLYEIDPANGNRLSTRQVIGRLDSAANNETDDLLTTYTYTTFGLLDAVTDPLGRMTDYDYDPLGRLVAITFAVGTADQATASFEYDTAGNSTALIDELGHRTQFVHDTLNRLTHIVQTDPDGSGPLASPITVFVYETRGH
ncbi:MAG: FG-GAP-like repeat-containing protein [Pirellulaceae bacterium]